MLPHIRGLTKKKIFESLYSTIGRVQTESQTGTNSFFSDGLFLQSIQLYHNPAG